MRYNFRPRGVCSQQITFEIIDGKLHDVRFAGGCNGNLKAIGMLTEGMDAKKVAELFVGNTCGYRDTTCADQFARAIGEALKQSAR